MILLLAFSLFAILSLNVLLWRWLKVSACKTQKFPPGPLRWPILGNLLQLGPLPHRDMATLCDKYGSLVYLRLGNVDAITTNDPDTIREILFRQDDVFSSRPKTLAALHLAYGCGDVALAPMGPHWKRMRRICMEHLLTTKRLESFTAQRAEETRYLIADVYKRAECGKLINLREVLGAFSMNNVTRMLLGKQFFGPGSVVGPKEAQEFMHITHKLFRLLGVIYLGDYLPFWRWVDPYGCEKEMKDVEKRVDKFHTKITEEHRRTKREREDNNNDNGEMDFVEVLLSLPGDNGKEHIEIKALIQWDMIAAATDTSAVTNEWAMAEVIKQPRAMRKIQEELDNIVGSNRMVDESDLVHFTRDVPDASGRTVLDPSRIRSTNDGQRLLHPSKDTSLHQHTWVGSKHEDMGRH
ncbi:unnamed protein product [Brassica oleracea var. botrytis]|uniref:(rape) hypothetical protein n=1 Tax=Brassica napus TaxID=3708 RepID=A0A816UPX5_BRANA|nr:unnamed protein product [Brassica napus]